MIINILLWIWSHTPVLSLSDDSNFGTLIKKEKGENDIIPFLKRYILRFSLINIILGDNIWYFITFNISDKKVSFIHKLSLEKMEGNSISCEKSNQLKERYVLHLNELNEQERDIEKEALCYHINGQEQRLALSIDKLNIYATIILTIIPLLLAIIEWKSIMYLPWYVILCIAMLVYILLNICIYIFRGIKVQAICKSTFSELKTSPKKKIEQIAQYYYDWQQLKYKADLFVSFVANVQQWVKALMLIAICTAILVTFTSFDKNLSYSVSSEPSMINLKYEEIDECYTESAIRWAQIILDIEKGNCTEIIVISNGKCNLNTLLDNLDKYKDVEIKCVKDNSLNDGEIKIIQEK